MTTGGWENRIVSNGEEDPSVLLANPRNWRSHPPEQRKALSAVLDRVGWVQQVVVNKNTGHLVDGHLRVELASERGEATIPVGYVDLTEAEEALVLASLDPISGMANADAEMLGMLLADIDMPDDGLSAVLDEIIANDAAMVAAAASDRESGHGTGARGLGNAVYQYNLVFDSEDDLKRWYAFVRTARARGAEESIAAAILRVLESTLAEVE